MIMRKTTLVPEQLLRSVHRKKSYLGEAGYPVLTTGNPLLKVALGECQTHVNSNRRQTNTRVTDLLQVHVNRPQDFVKSVSHP